MKFTLKQFNERFPTSDACLEELKSIRYADWKCPNCGSLALSKIKGRAQYASPCGYQVAPLSGTIFHKSSTDLRTWFMTMYLMTQTRGGISAKTVERTTGVTYKTAWRMMKQIRSLMDDGGSMLSGVVEADETFVAPNPRRDFRLNRGRNTNNGEILFGAVEREGKVVVKRVPNTVAPTLHQAIRDNVRPGSTIYTDGWTPYKHLPKLGYEHATVDHSGHEFTRGKVSTQTIESFWGAFKRGFRGSYIHCGGAYLQSYANEYAWRYSNRKSDVPMFELLMRKVTLLH